MNELTITLDKTPVNIMPSSVEEEIKQNIRMILDTPVYSVPLHRGFGNRSNYIDKPISVAKTILIGEMTKTIEELEPRVKVKSIKFDETELGKLKPIVEVIINEQ